MKETSVQGRPVPSAKSLSRSLMMTSRSVMGTLNWSIVEPPEVMVLPVMVIRVPSVRWVVGDTDLR